MTYEQNVRAILESNFAGFKDEIIDIACERICELTNPYDRVLKIIDEEDQNRRNELGVILDSGSITVADRIRNRVLALKGEH